MAHWTERHTKKDIVASYEKELSTLRAEVEMLERRAEISRLGAWEITKRENTLIAENERLRERVKATEYVLKQARPESGYWDTYSKEELQQ